MTLSSVPALRIVNPLFFPSSFVPEGGHISFKEREWNVEEDFNVLRLVIHSLSFSGYGIQYSSVLFFCIQEQYDEIDSHMATNIICH